MKKKILIVIILIAVTGGCGGRDQYHFQGYVEGENIYLASPYAGALVEALVERGQNVKKGELLFKLDSNPQAMAIMEATAGLQEAERQFLNLKAPRRPDEIAQIEAQIGQVTSKMALAELRVKRYQTLYEKHALAKDNLDAVKERYRELSYLKAQYEANLRLAKLGAREEQIKAQQAQIAVILARKDQATWQLNQKSIYAPADGLIFDTYFKQGEFVGALQPIASLLTPENIHVEFFVSSPMLAFMKVGKKITFDCDGCSVSNQAEIRYISPEAEFVPPVVYSRENRNKLVFRIKANIKNSAQFKPGQPVVVTVIKHD